MMKKIIIAAIFVFSLSTAIKNAFAILGTDVDLDKIVVTSSRIAQHDYKIASNVSVINKGEIEASNARNVIDIIQKELGVHTYDNSTPKTAVIDIRGFGDTASRNVLVLVNDRKINSIDIAGPDTLQIPLGAIERIEIIRGAGSVLYGDNAVGGVVNIITKQGKGPLTGKAGTSYGSFRTSEANAEISGSEKFKWLNLDNEVSYFMYSKYLDTGGYRDNSSLIAQDHNARFGYKLSDRVDLSLETGWHRDHYGLPGGLSFSELQTLGRRGSADPNDFADTKDRFIQLGFDIKPWPKDVDFGHFNVDFSYRNKDSYASFAAFDFNTKREIDAFGLTTKYIFDKTLFNRDFNFVSGIDFYDTNNHILGSGSNSDDLTIAKEEFGAYLFSEYEALEHLYVNAGTRFQKAEYTFDQKAAVQSFTTNKPSESVNMVGAKYEYAKGSNIFFDVQQTFRFLATDEWYDSFTGVLNTNLKQQTGIQYEAGIKHNFKDTTLVSVTPYWMDLKNEIFFNPSAGFFGSNDNYTKTRRTGIEVGQTTNVSKLVDTKFFNKIEFFTNYTFQNPEFIDGPNNNKKIPLAPEHQANIGISAGFLKNFSASLAGKYVGQTFAINDTLNATPPVKPYWTLDSKISYETKNLEIFTIFNNILNEQYYSYVVKSASSNAKDHFPAPGRNFLVGTKLKF